MRAAFGFDVTYEYSCDLCDKLIEQKSKIHRYEVLLYPSLPDGWRTIDGCILCVDHEIKVDGILR